MRNTFVCMSSSKCCRSTPRAWVKSGCQFTRRALRAIFSSAEFPHLSIFSDAREIICKTVSRSGDVGSRSGICFRVFAELLTVLNAMSPKKAITPSPKMASTSVKPLLSLVEGSAREQTLRQVLRDRSHAEEDDVPKHRRYWALQAPQVSARAGPLMLRRSGNRTSSELEIALIRCNIFFFVIGSATTLEVCDSSLK